MNSSKRLIEVAFPLKQTSLDSVHEKNVRHGHISTLHIWPARRPLAASRAALIATLLPDPENDTERKEILERLAGKIVERPKKKKQSDGRMVDVLSEETEGGILHWGRESGPDLEWFRQKIREAYGGRAPRVLDPFAGGGAIPLEAMRLGCEATAVDINPVAWFILKCTLEYPQRLAGQTRPLPAFALEDREFMQSFLKAKGYQGKALATELEKLGFDKAQDQQLPGFSAPTADLEADLAWHVRAWGRWVLVQARRDLARFYPVYADFEPLVDVAHAVERRPLTLVPLKEDGTADVDALNGEFGATYLADKQNPRWVAKPTVAYLWARTVTCKNCGTLIPLLKTRWLAKKDKKRVLLTMNTLSPKERLGQLAVEFGIQPNVPSKGHTPTERTAHDKGIGSGTMSRSGVYCPVCKQITMTSEDIRLEGKANRLSAVLTAVVVDGKHGKEYRRPTEHEIAVATVSETELDAIYEDVPFGLPTEPVPQGGSRAGGGSPFTTYIYGLEHWGDLFTKRQLANLGTFAKVTRDTISKIKEQNNDWAEPLGAYLAVIFDKLLNISSTLCTWNLTPQSIRGTFSRFALPITWDFVETSPLSEMGGTYSGAISVVGESLDFVFQSANFGDAVRVIKSSAQKVDTTVDLVLTDPPYYDAIPYSDLMDFFYVWLKRIIGDLTDEFSAMFSEDLSPKWDHEKNDGELIDDASRFGGSQEKSKNNYEDGMAIVFKNCFNVLSQDGRLVIVFAHKQPNAWETLVSAIVKAGFVVDGSWPIQTERAARTRALSSAALSSSVWLVCRKRHESIRPGWDNRVLEEMRVNISLRLRQFWDAGIRGPDFVWAATGPALEAYSQYPAVKKANQPGELLTVGEFLTHVRRMVVDFVVGRVLTHLSHVSPALEGNSGEGDSIDVSSLDSLTTYYLLHRNDFGFNDAPAGPCILYAVSCGLSDGDLADRYDLLARRGGKTDEEDVEEMDEDGGEDEEAEGTGSVFRLKAWNQRKRPNMGYEPGEEQVSSKLPMFPDLSVQRESTDGYAIPLIDQVHRLMFLWRAGDVTHVDEYLDRRALRRNQLFHQLLQALIELSPTGSEERSLLESISNHVGGNNYVRQNQFLA